MQRVRSQKYDVAVRKDIPVMTHAWVDAVWERSGKRTKKASLHATDPQFSRYKCPALMGIIFTVSQMNRKVSNTYMSEIGYTQYGL